MREESYHFLEKKNYFKKIHLDEVLFSRYSSKFPNPISKYPKTRAHSLPRDFSPTTSQTFSLSKETTTTTQIRWLHPPRYNHQFGSIEPR